MDAGKMLKNYRDHRGVIIKKYRTFWGRYIFLVEENGIHHKIDVGKKVFESFELGSRITVGVMNRKLINIRPGFCKVQPVSYSEIPPWDEIVEHMQGKSLSGFADTVEKVMVSRDRAKRILVLQSENGYFKVLYEEISVYEKDEWIFFCNDPDRYPAWWEPVSSSLNTASFYGTIDNALCAIKDSPEYKQYFA